MSTYEDDRRSMGHCPIHGDYNGRNIRCPECLSEATFPCDDPTNDSPYGFYEETEDDHDFEDIDCASCGMKFFIRPMAHPSGAPFPTECERCRKGLPPLYEY